MGNKHKGQLRVEVDGKSILLVIDHNALCEMEDALGNDSLTIVSGMFSDAAKNKVSAKLLRTIIWAAMLNAQPETTLLEAGNVANALGADLAETVGELLLQNGLLDIRGDDAADQEEKPSGNGKSSKG